MALHLVTGGGTNYKMLEFLEDGRGILGQCIQWLESKAWTPEKTPLVGNKIHQSQDVGAHHIPLSSDD